MIKTNFYTVTKKAHWMPNTNSKERSNGEACALRKDTHR